MFSFIESNQEKEINNQICGLVAVMKTEGEISNGFAHETGTNVIMEGHCSVLQASHLINEVSFVQIIVVALFLFRTA